MNWLADKLTKLMQERALTNDTLARQLGVERSRLSAIATGSALPNQSLIKRLAKYFNEDVEEWIGNAQQRGDAKPGTTSVSADFIKVAKVSEIPEGEMKIVFNNLAVVANSEGNFHAFGNICPHAGGPIGEGWLDGCVVECPWHAGQWDITTGKALTPLATADIPLFEVRVVDEDVEVRLSQAALGQGDTSAGGANLS
ncbi:MAG TPA: Rieske 2Fe-2S domain-containing protein [Rhodopila sp.]|jgi:nitrite reductase/ring-hydroxylating ferredoxin subunit